MNINEYLVFRLTISRSNIVKVNKSRRLRWAGHVARREEDRSAFKISIGTSAGKRFFRNALA